MKRMRTAGLCLVAAFALSALFATSAFALGGSSPEVGRCKPLAGGKYKLNKCTVKSVPGEEKYEWYPAEGAAKNGDKSKEMIVGGVCKAPAKCKYKSASKAETLIQLEGTGEKSGGVKTKVICKENAGKTKAGQTAEGEVTGLKTNIAFNIVFIECESGGSKCSNTATAGEIKVNELTGEIGIEKIGEETGVEKPLKDLLANKFVPKVGESFVKFTCAGLTVEVHGAVLNPIKTNTMVKSATVKFTASGGSQKPECFLTTFGEKQGKPPCNTTNEKVLLSKFETIPGAEFEESGQTLTTVQTNEESLEARVGAE